MYPLGHGGISAAAPLVASPVVVTLDTLFPGLGSLVGTVAIAATLGEDLARLSQARTMMELVRELARVLDKYGQIQVLRDLNATLLLDSRREGVRQGPNWWIMDGFDYGNPDCLLVDSMEGFFEVADQDRQRLVDDLQAVMDAVDGAGSVFGYLSIRFMGSTTAMLGMQQGERNCSIELTVVKDAAASAIALVEAQRATLDRGGRLHWGQRNEVVLDPFWRAQLNVMYPRFPDWIAVRDAFDHSGSIPGGRPSDRTFMNEFLRRLIDR